MTGLAWPTLETFKGSPVEYAGAVQAVASNREQTLLTLAWLRKWGQTVGAREFQSASAIMLGVSALRSHKGTIRLQQGTTAEPGQIVGTVAWLAVTTERLADPVLDEWRELSGPKKGHAYRAGVLDRFTVEVRAGLGWDLRQRRTLDAGGLPTWPDIRGVTDE